MISEPRVASWQDEAACRGHDPALVFPANTDALGPARAICATCPVFDPCWQTGLHEQHGIWAGTSERERKQIRKTLGIHLTHEPEPQETAS